MVQGQPCVELSLPEGDQVLVALHGAQVISWRTADGRERLYLSPIAELDGQQPIRGGVPLCFPQFNQRVLGGQPLAKHGFARTQPWAVQFPEPDTNAEEGTCEVTLALNDNADTLAQWPHTFAARLTVRLESGRLHIQCEVDNTDAGPWLFALALHTYLLVDGIESCTLHGLEGHAFWDAVAHLDTPDVVSTQADQALAFSGETDRVYGAVTTPLVLRHAGGTVRLTQSASLPDVVVWNPGAIRCAALADMPLDGFKHMLCVEAACINTPVSLEPGCTWRGWQQFEVT
jgi:glucose-6-phosphate 1-epimerase